MFSLGQAFEQLSLQIYAVLRSTLACSWEIRAVVYCDMRHAEPNSKGVLVWAVPVPSSEVFVCYRCKGWKAPIAQFAE